MVFSQFLFPAIALFVAIANCLPLRASVDLVRREQEVLERRVIPITFHANSGVREEHKAGIEADIRTHMANNMNPNTVARTGSISVRQGPHLSVNGAGGVTDSKHVTVDFKGEQSHHHVTTQHVFPGGVHQNVANARHEALHGEIRNHDFQHREANRQAAASKADAEREEGHVKEHKDHIKDSRRARATAHKAGDTAKVGEHDANIRAHSTQRDVHQVNANTHRTAEAAHHTTADHHKAEATRKRTEVDTKNPRKHTWP